MLDNKVSQLVFAIVIAALVGVLGYAFLKSARAPLIFSPTQVLGALWDEYKVHTLEPSSGRTVDRSRNNITTSEGQSYTMLRAAWMGDKATFDRSWQWTRTNLARPDDHLFAWLYGERTDGSYGVLATQGGLSRSRERRRGEGPRGSCLLRAELLWARSKWDES